MAKVALRMFHW